jgi:hypothetical protein
VGKSQAHKSGGVRRTNDRFTLKTSAPDSRGPPYLLHSAHGDNGPSTRCCGRFSSTPQQVVVLAGEEGFEPFDLLIQSQLPESGLASRVLSVRRASVGRRCGVSQVPIPK